MNIRSITSAAALVATAALLLSGCASAPPSNGEGLRVVATTTQVGDFTHEVGRLGIQLTTLLSPGASAHDFDPTQANMIALADADVLVINGLDLEPFIDDAIATSGFQGALVDASSGIQLDADHAESDTHEHGSVNPHIWTSPVLASEMVANIAADLSEADPARAKSYAVNAGEYQAKLAVLDEWITANIAQVPADERVFVSGHDSLAYYLDEYDIEFVGSILPSFEDNADPSVAEIDDLIRAIRDGGVKAIFVESSMNPKIAERIATESGAKLINHDVIYADSLGSPGSGAETYIGATVHNTRVILEAWGYTPTPLPAELEGY